MEKLRILIKMKQTEMETGGDNKQFLKLLINIYTDTLQQFWVFTREIFPPLYLVCVYI